MSCCTPAHDLKIIASSREVLGMAGETVYRVPVPGAARMIARLTPESADGSSEAARLFVERARAGPAALYPAPTATPRPWRRFAGAWTASRWRWSWLRHASSCSRSSRSPSGLDDRFRLLIGGSRTALPRQQTLRALMDWSYDLLPRGGAPVAAPALGLRRRLDVGSRRSSRHQCLTCWMCWSSWSTNRWSVWTEQGGEAALPPAGDHPPVRPRKTARSGRSGETCETATWSSTWDWLKPLSPNCSAGR